VWGQPGLIFGAELLGHDPFQAKLANVSEGDVSWHVDRLTDQKASTVHSRQPNERILAPLNRLAAEIFTVQFQEIKPIELG
jgi:hypothetical protein